MNSIFNNFTINIKEKIDNIILKEYNNSFIKECICCNNNNIYVVKSFTPFNI